MDCKVRGLWMPVAGLLLAVVLVLTAMPVYAGDAGVAPMAGAAKTVAVQMSYQADDSGFVIARQAFDVASDLAETYGYTDAFGGAEVSVLDAVVAAHTLVFGPEQEDVRAALTVGSGGFLSNFMGDGSGNFSYFVNTEMPLVGVTDTKLADGDLVELVTIQDSYYMDTYAWFEVDGAKTEMLEVYAGDEVELTVAGIWCVIYGDWGATEVKVDGAGIVPVTLDTGAGIFGAPLAVTDDEGKATVPAFEEEGTYILSAIDVDGAYASPLISPWLVVTVVDAEKKLQDAIDAASALIPSKPDYTPESWAGVETALGLAKLAAALGDDVPKDVRSDIANALNAAVKGLAGAGAEGGDPDEDAADPATAKAKENLAAIAMVAVKLKESAYTEASWTQLEDALAKATSVAVRQDATKAEVDAAYAALDAAIAGLTLKGADTQVAEGDVPQAAPAAAPQVTEIRAALSSYTLVKGKTLSIAALAYGDAGADKTLTWTTSEGKVATVDKNGKVKGVKTGKARITATAKNGVSETFTVKVVKKATAVKSLKVYGGGDTVKVGKTKTLYVSLNPKGTTAQPTFKSDKPSVLKVDKTGRLTARKPGEATITVKAGGKAWTKTFMVVK